MNFGDRFIDWIHILYYNPTFFIKNNGWLSKSIKMERGIRQGCPVSALIFVLAIELMSVNIRENNTIKGMSIKGKERKLSQYADDSTLTLTDIPSLGEAVQTVDKFCNISGMKLNKQKSEGIWLGSLKDFPEIFEGIKFTRKAIRILDVYLGHDKEQCHEENWLNKINRIKNSIHVWKRRKLTMYGKILLLKTMALSKLVYSMSLLHVPIEIIKEINKCFYSFLWNKVDRIKRNTLISDYKDGGVKMVDLECMAMSLKASWVLRLQKMDLEQSIFNLYIDKCGLNLSVLLKGRIIDEKYFPENIYIPSFYKECIRSFISCQHLRPLQNVHV